MAGRREVERRADVAPSILHIMGLEQPSDMTGECLISDNRQGRICKQ